MKNIKNNKGFTLAELLIVIAIIAALVAIMIPTFRGQVENAKRAADVANLRAAYADATSEYLEKGTSSPKNITITSDGGVEESVKNSLPFTFPTWKSDATKVTFDFSTDKPGCTLS